MDMLGNLSLMKRTGLALLIWLITPLAYSCFFHQGGFGYGPGQGFQDQPAGMSYTPMTARPDPDAKLRLTLPAMLRGSIEEEKSLTVSFDYADEIADPSIELFIDLMPGMTVDEDTIRLQGKSGQHTFQLQPQQTGIFRLIVTARDVNNDDIPELREVVFVKIFN